MKDKVIIGVLSGIIIGIFASFIFFASLTIKKDKFDIGEVVKQEDDFIVIKGNNTTTKTKATSINVGDIIKQENNTTTIIKTTTTTNTTKSITESDIINTFSQDYDYVKSSTNLNEQGKIKSVFIKIVDFIFYDTDINGVHFKDLTTKGKMSVIKYALLIDGKINEYFPNYKDELGEKYQFVKDKLISEYMNSLTYVCSKNKDECDTLKGEFNELRKSISITWSNLKEAFKNGANKTKTTLEEWYKIFKNS